MPSTRVCCSCWRVIVPSRPHQGEDCSTVPLLDITHSTSLPFSFCHFPSSHSLSCFLSPSLCIWITSSLPLFPSFFVCLPAVKSSLIYCIRHVSVFPLFFFSRRPHLTPLLPYQLWVFLQIKATLSLFIWACLFHIPLVLVFRGFS